MHTPSCGVIDLLYVSPPAQNHELCAGRQRPPFCSSNGSKFGKAGSDEKSKFIDNLSFDQFLNNGNTKRWVYGVGPDGFDIRLTRNEEKSQAKDACPLCLFHASLSPRCVRSFCFAFTSYYFVHFELLTGYRYTQRTSQFES